MLKHRTNVLLSEEDYQLLSEIALEHKKSRGAILRLSWRKAFGDTIQKKKRQKSAQQHPLLELRKLFSGVRITQQEVREFVEYGRK